MMKATKQQKAKTSGHRITTLIVDDSPFIHASLAQFLGKVPYIKIVGNATNGLDAVRQVSRQLPQLVVMDFQMPEMDGLEATRLIRQRHPGVRIILMTAHDVEHVRAGGISNGADAFLSKQRLPNELRPAISRLFPQVPSSNLEELGEALLAKVPTEGKGLSSATNKKTRIPIRFLDPASSLDEVSTPRTSTPTNVGPSPSAGQGIDPHDLERRVKERTASLTQRIAELESSRHDLIHELRNKFRHMHSYGYLSLRDSESHLSETAARHLQKVLTLGEESLSLLEAESKKAKPDQAE
jgi:DNA-binding NarL/FixJ family response regulator